MIKILDLKNVSRDEIFARCENSVDVSKVVKDIIDNVRINKDKALYEYSYKFDKVMLDNLEVSKEEIANEEKEIEELIKSEKSNNS